MKTRHILVFAFILTALLLQACGASNTEAAVQTAIFQTQQISQLQTAAAGGGGQTGGDTGGTGGQPAAPSDTPQPSSTPTITLTPTPSIPYVQVSSNTNCRSGPGTSYTLLTTINVGQQAEVIKLFNNDYVLVKNPNGSGDCWLWLQYANTHDFSAYSLPFATQPPTSTPTLTPTPDFDWDGSWNVWVISGGTTYTGTGSFDVSGNNISGTFHLGGGLDYHFAGSLNSSRQKASGKWVLDPGDLATSTYTFVWQIKSGNHLQFTGNLDQSGTPYEMCGARSGTSQPSPCVGP